MVITLNNFYQIVVVASILCGGAYSLGYEIGKNAKK